MFVVILWFSFFGGFSRYDRSNVFTSRNWINYNGNFSVFISYTEDGGENYETTTSFDVTVTPTNDAPSVVALPVQTDNEDNTISVDLSATDIDGDSEFTFSGEVNSGENIVNNYKKILS